jgi:hypothetical protein
MLSTLETRDNLQRNIGLCCKILNFISAKYFLSAVFLQSAEGVGIEPPVCKERLFCLVVMVGRWLEDGWGRGNHT